MWDSYDESMTLRLLDEANYDAEMESKVLPALDACMTEGWMDPATVDWNGDALPKLDEPGRLHYCCYDAHKFDVLREDGASGIFRGVVVISHGFTEFARKYSEMAWYFLLSGYSVCILEHRGHGHSARDVSNPSLVWIDDWRRYVADFAAFADTVGREYACGEPLNLYCHSMGGGIGAAVMEHIRACSTRPCCPPDDRPRHRHADMDGARIAAGALCGLGFGKARVFGHTDFSPELDLDEHKGASEARVRWFHKQRVDDVACQTNAATFEWAHQAMALSRAILKPDMCGAYRNPDAAVPSRTRHLGAQRTAGRFRGTRARRWRINRKNTVRQVVARDLLHAEHGGRTVCGQDSRLPQRARGQSVSGCHCKTHAACTVCDERTVKGKEPQWRKKRSNARRKT